MRKERGLRGGRPDKYDGSLFLALSDMGASYNGDAASTDFHKRVHSSQELGSARRASESPQKAPVDKSKPRKVRTLRPPITKKESPLPHEDYSSPGPERGRVRIQESSLAQSVSKSSNERQRQS